VASLVIPVEVLWAKFYEASAPANVEVNIEVVANSARLFIATANLVFVVVEKACWAWLGDKRPSAISFVPVVVFCSEIGWFSCIWQADTFVSPVIIVLQSTAFEWYVSALAPFFLPVSTGSAILWIALASTPGSVPVVVNWAGLWNAVACCVNLIPVESWQAACIHLHANAGFSIKSPLDTLYRDSISVLCVCKTVKWDTSAVANILIPVSFSHISIEICVFCSAILGWAAA
jgi:hypothetical protein